MQKRNCGLQVTGYSLCGSGIARLKVKALVWKRNCVTSKPQYLPCAEAELRHFRAPSHTLFCMRKRKCGTLSLSPFLVRWRNFKSKNILRVEADCRTSSHIMVCVRKRNFKSHNSLYVESLWFLIRSGRERRAEGPCVKAILAVLSSAVPS